jgi:MFS family permease
MLLCSRFVTRYGSRRVTRAGALAATLTLPFAALAHDLPALAGALLAVGMGSGVLDVAMNAQGVAVERRLGRPVLSGMHAAFSAGAMVGAGLGALMAATDVNPLPHFTAVAVVLAAGTTLCGRHLLRDDADPHADSPRMTLRRVPPRLIVLGAATFCCFLAEGAASDWSAVLVSGPLGSTPSVGALVYTVFSLAMVTGRLAGDGLAARWGPVRLLRRSGALATMGIVTAVVGGTPAAAFAGFAALGLGLAGVVPATFRAGGQTRGVATAPALAFVTVLGYGGLLSGPAIIGGLAELTGLRTAMLLLALMGLAVAVLAPATAPPPAGSWPGGKPTLESA